MPDVEFIKYYFNLEQEHAVYFMGVGAIAMAGSIGMALFYKKQILWGLMIGISSLSLIELVVGSTVYFRSPDDIERVMSYVDENEASLKESEMVRMEEVMSSFALLKKIEVAVIVLGLLSLLLIKRRKLVSGIGIGISFQALIMLFMDIQAEERAAKYISSLSELINQLESIC